MERKKFTVHDADRVKWRGRKQKQNRMQVGFLQVLFWPIMPVQGVKWGHKFGKDKFGIICYTGVNVTRSTWRNNGTSAVWWNPRRAQVERPWVGRNGGLWVCFISEFRSSVMGNDVWLAGLAVLLSFVRPAEPECCFGMLVGLDMRGCFNQGMKGFRRDQKFWGSSKVESMSYVIVKTPGTHWTLIHLKFWAKQQSKDLVVW